MPERKEALPKDKVNLRLLLVTGKSHDFLFDPNTSGTEIASHIFANWPSEWEDDDVILKPPRHEVLRFLYRGKFLHSTTTLTSLSLPLGKTSVMHLVVRERLPDEHSQDQVYFAHYKSMLYNTLIIQSLIILTLHTLFALIN